MGSFCRKNTYNSDSLSSIILDESLESNHLNTIVNEYLLKRKFGD